jgi:hypothetical protein
MHAEHGPASVAASLAGAMVTVTVTTIRAVLSLSNATLKVIAPARRDKKGKEHVSVV